jgi:hypothetical protein
VNNNDDDDKTLLAQRTSPVGDGGLSIPHTNFGGGGWVAIPSRVGRLGGPGAAGKKPRDCTTLGQNHVWENGIHIYIHHGPR